MRRLIDLTGRKFGKLTVVKRVEDNISKSGYKSAQWLCVCDCGNEVIVTGRNLKTNNTKSCGCLQKEIVSKTNKKYNTYDLTGEYGIGYTSKGEEFYFDLEDYNKIKSHCWFFDGYDRYIAANINGKKVHLHKIILKCKNNTEVDHINRKKYDCRKSNLRIATRSQNSMNKDLRSNNTSGVTGVNWNKKENKWESRISVNNKAVRLGYYSCFDDAVKARLVGEKYYYGEFAPQKHLFKQYPIE